MKRCTQCHADKSASSFNKAKRHKDGLQSSCRECQKEAYRTYYEVNHKERTKRIQLNQKKRREKTREYLADYLNKHPCVDCGCKDIRVLDFDHVKDSKADTVTHLMNTGHSLETVKQEVLKCEIRCRNCHAIKTYERLGGSWRDEFVQQSPSH